MQLPLWLYLQLLLRDLVSDDSAAVDFDLNQATLRPEVTRALLSGQLIGQLLQSIRQAVVTKAPELKTLFQFDPLMALEVDWKLVRKELRKIGLDLCKMTIDERAVAGLLRYLLEYEKGGGPLRVLQNVLAKMEAPLSSA